MAERTPEGAVWGYFLWAREIAKLSSLVTELRVSLFTKDDLVQMTFSLAFVTILEGVDGNDVKLFDLS